MNNDEILDSIEYVDPQLISKAESYTYVKKNQHLLKWSSVAACLCFAVLGSIVIPKITSHNTVQKPEASVDSNEHSASALYTDRIIIPENTDGSEVDMIGCLVYKGSVYTQGESFHGDLSSVEHLVGDYIGEAKGTLEECSTQDEFATEFASTYSGPVYSVKGYSEDFRLCIYVECRNERWLQFLDNFDGIGLSTGKDLFEERFHIKGNVSEVMYLTHYDWDYNGLTDRTYHKLDKVTVDQFNEFMDTLYSSPFKRIDYSETPDFYNTEIQGHLYLEMKDGTCVELTLIDGGYVGCTELGWYFVYMPGDIFDAILSVCQ